MKNPISTDVAYGAAGVSIVCAVMLLWPLFGNPPYGYYSVLKLVVAAGSGYAAYALWNLSARLAPICLLLLVSGAIHLLSKMHRVDWVLFNWAAVGLFSIAATIIVVFLRASRRRTYNEQKG